MPAVMLSEIIYSLGCKRSASFEPTVWVRLKQAVVVEVV